MSQVTKKSIKIKILEAAKSCFLEKGYTETTMRDIASKADISPGTIYIYFKGKKALFQALNIPEVEDIRPQYDQKKNTVLQKALLLFGEKGFNGVTMDDIASNLGISKSSLYQYCTSKEDLFSQILQSSSFNMYTQNLTAAEYEPDLREIIKTIGRSYLEIGENPQRCALLKTVIKDSATFPSLGELYFEQGIKPACTNIINYIRKHCEKHYIPVKHKEHFFSFVLTYIGSLQSYVLMNDVICGINTGIEREEYLEHTTDIFMDYLKANHYI